MWRKFCALLGRCVQGVLNIFRRRETKAPMRGNEIYIGKINDNFKIPTLDVISLEEPEPNPYPGKTATFTVENAQINTDFLLELAGNSSSPMKIEFTVEQPKDTSIMDNINKITDRICDKYIGDILDEVIEMLKNSVNTLRTNLPKRIHVNTLLISIVANQEYEYHAADFSQYEEKGIVHLIHGYDKDIETIEEEYRNDTEDQESEFVWSDEDLCTVAARDVYIWEIEGQWFYF